MKTTDIKIIESNNIISGVILTMGMTRAEGGRSYAAFANEDDARSSQADELAIGRFAGVDLTEEQRRIAWDNTEELSTELL